jgi:hypothetical protein
VLLAVLGVVSLRAAIAVGRKEKEEEMDDWKQKEKQFQEGLNRSLIPFCIDFLSRDIIIITIIIINYYYTVIFQYDSISVKKLQFLKFTLLPSSIL